MSFKTEVEEGMINMATVFFHVIRDFHFTSEFFLHMFTLTSDYLQLFKSHSGQI